MLRTYGLLAATLAATLATATTAVAHSEYPLRPPTAKERAAFEQHRTKAAREASKQADPSRGSFSAPFTEPTLGDGRGTDQDCVTNDDGTKSCNPAAGTMTVPPTGRILYGNALEGTENIKPSIVNEYGAKSINDQTRLLDLNGPIWTRPTPN